MRIRIAACAAAAAAAALLTLTACSDDDKGPTPPASSAPASATTAPSSDTGADPTAEAGSGGSSGLDPATQELLITSLRKVDPSLADDPARTAANAQEQCAALANDADPSGHAAAQKFSTPEHPLTDAQGQAINAALNALVCEPDFG
jgi:hypothetical protein